jgi:hypothetical protein
MRISVIDHIAGTYPLQFTNVWNGTKLLFDDNITEIAAFKNRLEITYIF